MAGEIDEPYRRGEAQELIAKELLRRGQTEDAVALARGIEHPSSRLSSLVALSDGVREKEPDLASTLLIQARDSVKSIDLGFHRAQACQSLACALVRIGKSANVGDLAEIAVRAAGATKEEWQKHSALASAAVTTAAGGNLAEAVNLAGTLGDYGHEDCLEEIAAVQVDAGDVPGALKTLEACKNRFHLSRVLLKIALAARNPDLRRAGLRDSFKAMDTVDSKSRSLNDFRNGNPLHDHLWHLMDEFAKAGDFEMSTAVAARLTQDLGNYSGSYARLRVALHQAESGGLQAALEWIGKLDDPMQRALSLTGAAEGLLARSRR